MAQTSLLFSTLAFMLALSSLTTGRRIPPGEISDPSLAAIEEEIERIQDLIPVVDETRRFDQLDSLLRERRNRERDSDLSRLAENILEQEDNLDEDDDVAPADDDYDYYELNSSM